jgi:hypothetical protein
VCVVLCQNRSVTLLLSKSTLLALKVTVPTSLANVLAFFLFDARTCRISMSSDELLAGLEEKWDKAVNHEFIKACIDGIVKPEQFNRWLVQVRGQIWVQLLLWTPRPAAPAQQQQQQQQQKCQISITCTACQQFSTPRLIAKINFYF